MTTLSKLKVGDRLADSGAPLDQTKSNYGEFINRFVHSIRITKSGRYVIEVKDQYKYVDGRISDPAVRRMYNGAVVGHTAVKLYNT